jgi:hypothetical protein
MTSFSIYFVTVEYAMASDPSTCTSSVWRSLALAENPWGGETQQLTFDPCRLAYVLNERSHQGAEKWILSPWLLVRSESGYCL